jgi:DNA-binding transcriptional LysR family regulator
MPIELRWLRSFVFVAEEMHFSRAARKLNLAQPALTTQIRQLEHAVGAPLFERTNRMGGLTAAGRALLPEARAMVERAGSLINTVKRAALGETGHLRLGVIPPAATVALAECLRIFAQELPGIELTVQQGNQDKLIDRLLGNELDLLIARPTANDQQGGALRQRRLFSEEQGIIIREDDPLAKQSSVAVTKLANRHLLLLRGNVHFGQLLLGHAARHGIRLTAVHVAEDFPSLHWMVRAGLGIAPCSLLLADGLPRGLVAKKLKPAPARLEINAIWCGAKPAPAAARLIQKLGNNFLAN